MTTAFTNIKSGYFTTPSNTPTGVPKAVATDNPYLTKDEFLQNELAIGLGVTTSSAIYTSGRLDKIMVIASATVNRICRRWFDTQTIDETMTGITVRPWNPQLVTVSLQNSPYQQIHTIYFQVLKWFIQIDISNSSGYLQDFPDLGFYKIVPLLSNSGTGTGSPMPAEIVDKTPLGVIWTNYTFGYGTQITGEILTGTDGTVYKAYQAPLYNRLWAPSQTLNVYKNATLVASNLYTVDYANGIVTFLTANIISDIISADFTSNESVPFELKQAVSYIAADMIAMGGSNPTGAISIGMQTFNINYGNGDTGNMRRAKDLLKNLSNNNIVII